MPQPPLGARLRSPGRSEPCPVYLLRVDIAAPFALFTFGPTTDIRFECISDPAARAPQCWPVVERFSEGADILMHQWTAFYPDARSVV